MQNTRYDAVFFDFDGTLVDSEKLKKDAFFALFPSEPEYERIVREVLREDPDGSRYAVIPSMLDRMVQKGLSVSGRNNPDALVARYGNLVLESVSNADEMPGAAYVLDELRKAGVQLFLCSNTPEEPLRQILIARAWLGFFDRVSGYPSKKEDFIRNLLKEKAISPYKALMVGDGPSDETAARQNSIEFRKVDGARSLDEVVNLWEVIDSV